MLTVVMPMAGLGSRFSATGEMRPKPLISVAGVPMFRLALDSIRVEQPDAAVVFVILAEHDRQFGLGATLQAVSPSSRVAVVPELTGGALETCLAAEAHVAPDDPVMIVDCDLTFHAPGYFARFLASSLPPDGMLLAFRSRDARYSYAEISDGRVMRTAEKQAISDNALIGAYGFQTAQAFFAAAHAIVARNLRTGNGEFYVSSAYNHLIESGADVRLEHAERYWSMGTPEELRRCLADQAFLAHVSELRDQGAPATAIS